MSYSKMLRTGLMKFCPRCHAVAGEVFVEDIGDGQQTQMATIAWRGVKDPDGLPAQDAAVAIEDLFQPDFGCGYCKPKRGLRAVDPEDAVGPGCRCGKFKRFIEGQTAAFADVGPRTEFHTLHGCVVGPGPMFMLAGDLPAS